MSVRTRSGLGLGTGLVLAAAIGLASVFWSTSTDNAPYPKQRHRVHILVEITNKVPGKVLATRAGVPFHDNVIVTSWVHDEIVPAEDQPVKFTATTTVTQANRRGVIKCRIDVDGQPKDSHEIRFHANGGTTKLTCAVTVG